MKLTDAIRKLTEDAVAALGFELDDVEYQKEYGAMVLTFYIDSPNGVTLDDCERVSRALDPILDAADPIDEAYCMSVSSVGIDRPIKKDRDFERNMGFVVEVKLYAPLDGKKEYRGVLKAFDKSSFTIDLGAKELSIPRKSAALLRQYIDFSDTGKQTNDQ